jgi:BirA family transcriptional regulator, biotin operon repressor / biotin---[acetyl-CoA-carboxylase] ligase
MTSEQILKSELKCQTRFASMLHLATCESTQDVSREQSRGFSGDPDDAIIWADHQTRGRGRQQRMWMDASGLDLAVTLRVTARLPQPLALAGALPVAVLQACEGVLEHPLRIKWPNDIYYQHQKLSGVLIDRESTQPDTYHIGIGLNVNSRQFPESLGDRATSLALLTGKDHDRSERLLALAKSVDQMISDLSNGDVSNHEHLFRERLGLINKEVEVQAQETVRGTLKAINLERVMIEGHPEIPLAIVRSLQAVSG